jgi:hypothetical protein
LTGELIMQENLETRKCRAAAETKRRLAEAEDGAGRVFFCIINCA